MELSICTFVYEREDRFVRRKQEVQLYLFFLHFYVVFLFSLKLIFSAVNSAFRSKVIGNRLAINLKSISIWICRFKIFLNVDFSGY